MRFLTSLFSVIIFCLAALSSLAHAQEQEDAILVLDASGSMWGRIDDEEKIVAARRVIGGLLDSLPAERRLGLVAYGHNRKGDCTDIEELAPVGTDRGAIRTAVNNIVPKGKTPLSASVKFAAEKLRYTENKATVILISDGIETCDLDPCAVGNDLERAGIDFTAHVIGFGLDAEQDKVQLRCLAENTGGQFVDAASAEELGAALNETVIEAPQAVREAGLLLRATELAGGLLVESGLSWRVQQAGGGDVLFEAADSGEVLATLPPGVYDVFVERPADGLKGSANNVELTPGAQKTVTIALELSFEASVRTVPEANAPVSSELVVYWTGPERKGDYVTIVPKGAPASQYKSYKYVQSGNPVTLKMPVEPGEYEVRYILGRPVQVLASTLIVADAVSASLSAADSVAAGSAIEVTWEGPGYSGDWITIVKPDAGERAYKSYAYPKNGNPLTLKAPLEAGEYELRYVQAGKKVLARRPITVTDVTATISGPATAMAGTHHNISWTGPGAKGDWITITAPTASESSYNDYAYVQNGNPLELRMPLEAGAYELRYVQAGKKVIARQAVTITAAEATLNAPSSAPAGSVVEVAWSGPSQKGDWLTVVKSTAGQNAYNDYKYAKNGNPSLIKMPVTPGTYELRYVLNGKKVIARKSIEVTDVSATLNAPASVMAGSEIRVEWSGPANKGDWLTITTPSMRESGYGSYKYASNGSPSILRAPKAAGEYELRYVLDGKRVIGRKPISVTPAQ